MKISKKKVLRYGTDTAKEGIDAILNRTLIICIGMLGIYLLFKYF